VTAPKAARAQGQPHHPGPGDPKLVGWSGKVWLLLRRVGLAQDHHHYPADRSAFALSPHNAADFHEPCPYNAMPDALLINFKSVVMTFTPNASKLASEGRTKNAQRH
jgi:D-alanyl-D-alanine carboxypeptidase/D-alanyl-D-alanine-endopeptidase (penicillin-binding protein 4)